MTIDELAKEVGDLRRRLTLAETKLSQQVGQFEFITGQLRDVQLYTHARFDDVDKRFDKVDARLDKVDARLDRIDSKVDGLDAKVDALPRIIAEMITKR
jgi:tetrahydromethanopterin S-methyltransferase subunit G